MNTVDILNKGHINLPISTNINITYLYLQICNLLIIKHIKIKIKNVLSTQAWKLIYTVMST